MAIPMRLNFKLLIVLTILLGGLLIGSVAIQYYIIYPSFVALERREAIKDWERCREGILGEVNQLSLLNCDWSGWDDTYNYVQDKRPSYHAENLANEDWYKAQRVDAVYIIGQDGRMYWSRKADHQTGEPLTISWLPAEGLSADHLVMKQQPTRESVVCGLVMTESGPMIVAARPILTSEYTGPMMGVLIFGRLLDEAVLEEIHTQTQVHFVAEVLSSQSIATEDRPLIDQAIAQRVPQIGEGGSEKQAVVGVLNDVYGQPMLVIKTDHVRAIVAQGRQVMIFATISLAVAATATLLTLLLALRWMVIRPLAKLNAHMAQISADGQLHTRLNSRRRDEIGQLANDFDGMLSRLEEYRNQALAMSRQAGMAEVATGVLHNVGNVLNSVNVSARMIVDNLRSSRLGSLGKLCQLIQQEREHLGEFVTTDARGKCLPEFLEQLHTRLQQDQQNTQKEVHELVRGIEHIMQVVNMQQSSASPSTMATLCEPTSIMEEAVKMNLASMERHQVELHREYEANLPHMMLDRHKVLQILINLISNAKKATCRSEAGHRHIVLYVGRVQEEQAVEFSVKDNGVGIASEDLPKLFRHGFSSFDQGHGFGLHSGANAAGEMNGSLTAHSDGPGRGAIFTLRIPVGESAVGGMAA